MRLINADKLRIDSWKTVEDAIFDVTHAPTVKTAMEKCMHYDTCKDSPVTLCGKPAWSDEGCMKPLVSKEEFTDVEAKKG